LYSGKIRGKKEEISLVKGIKEEMKLAMDWLLCEYIEVGVIQERC